MIDNYSTYEYTKKEWLIYFLQGALLGLAVGILVYSNIAAVFLMIYGFLYLRQKKIKLIEKRKWELNLEFRDGLASISSALNAGYSVENSFYQAVTDLKLMYPNDAYIVTEFEGIVNHINMNLPVEDILLDFANRSGIEDISNFAEVFKTAKRTGGDLIKIIKATSNTIGDKIEIKKEILILLAAKRFESNIMCLIPFGIILYLRVCSGGFLEPIYHNVFGFLFMTIMLIIYYCGFLLAQKIVSIEV